MNLNICIKTGNIMIFISSRKNSIHIQFIKNKLIYFNPSSFISRSVAAFISGFISKYSCVCKRKVISKLNFFNTSRFSLQRRIQIRSNICHGDFLQKQFTAENLRLCFVKAPSWMFDWVINMPLLWTNSQAYLGTCQTSMMELFSKIC